MQRHVMRNPALTPSNRTAAWLHSCILDPFEIEFTIQRIHITSNWRARRELHTPLMLTPPHDTVLMHELNASSNL